MVESVLCPQPLMIPSTHSQGMFDVPTPSSHSSFCGVTAANRYYLKTTGSTATMIGVVA